MDVVVAVTMIHVLLFVFHVCMLRECEGDGNAGVGNGGGVVAASAGVCMGCTPGLGVSSADNVLEMSVMCRVRGVSGMCEMRLCLARGVVGVRCLGLTNPVGTGKVWDMCLCCDSVGGELGG